MTLDETLELASTVQLYDALAKRFDTIVFFGVQARPTDEIPQNENRMRRFKGHPHHCAGLCVDLTTRLSHSIAAQEVHLPDDGL